MSGCLLSAHYVYSNTSQRLVLAKQNAIQDFVSEQTPKRVIFVNVECITNNMITLCVGVQLCARYYTYCKSTNFGVLLYLANLTNCMFSLIYVKPTYVIVR